MVFSIIVPVYNVETYLSESIESVLKQDFSDWEMILVNDGSTDDTGKIADDYAKKYPNIRVLHKNNEGQFRARKAGIPLAQGEYVLFLDGDDIYSFDALPRLNAYIELYHPDIVMFAGERFGNVSGTKEIPSFSNRVEVVNKQSLYESLISSYHYNSVCLKAYKKHILEADEEEYSFLVGAAFGEDKVMNLYPITKAQKILSVPDVLYQYRIHHSSVTRHIRFDKIPMMIGDGVYDFIYQYMKQWDMQDANHTEALAVHYLTNFMTVFYNTRKACVNTKRRKEFAKYPWRKAINKKALRYMFCKRLNLKSKIMLIVALYFYKIVAFI